MELDKFMKRLYDVMLAVAGNYPMEQDLFCPEQHRNAALSSFLC